MVTEVIRYELPGEKVASFLEAYRASAQHLLADRHCLGVDILHGIDAPTRVVIRIEWDSIEGHATHFTNGPHFPPFISNLRPFLEHIVEMAHYERVLHADKASPQQADS